MAMQILGGIGYVRETGAEKILRDALVIPVYEGTSQIQALMALKDNLQRALRRPARFVQDLATARLESLSSKDPLARAAAKLRLHSLSAMQTILMRIAADKLGDVRHLPFSTWKQVFTKDWNPQRDFAFGLLHAERLTRLLAYAAVGDVLVRQAEEARGTPHHEERVDLAQRFLERFEPRARGVLLEIEATSGSFLGRILRRGKIPVAPPDALAHAAE
jgi:hypothetical protein